MIELTDRERQVLQLLACGLTHEAIAMRLSIGRQSVRKHIVRICEKAFSDVRSPRLREVIEQKLLSEEG